MDQLDEALFERVVQWAAVHMGEHKVREARQRFEEATGPIEETDAHFESRMAHFFEQWLCEQRAGDSLLETYALLSARPPEGALLSARPPEGALLSARPPEGALRLPPKELAQLAGWQRSHRSLLAFEGYEHGRGVLRDLLLGGRYRFTPGPRDRELGVGDSFDGRLLAWSDRLWLMPGRVYHPRAAHVALGQLLRSPKVAALPVRPLLDGLLRMRSRFMRFESIGAEHVYSVDALADSAFAASWASPARRHQ